MLTKLIVRNFKRFSEVEIELGNPVVFIGPNNSGKTTALQALALWHLGLKRWLERRGEGETPSKRPGVTINRKDLFSVPAPTSLYLWRDLHVRQVETANGGRETQNIRIDVLVEGVSDGAEWKCGFEFDYANEESFYCRPIRTAEGREPARMGVPAAARGVTVSFLPPMSGLIASETELPTGAVNVRLGEGRTAEILRNLCHQVASGENGEAHWRSLCGRIRALFGVELDEPRRVPERGEIEMSYREPSGVRLDLSSSGRGLQQTLLLLAHMYSNRGAVLLLDEPDAHLEVLRQRQIYKVLTDVGREFGAQIVAASHSEVVLEEAADRDVVVAFVGKPHRIDDRGSQVAKSLKSIGFEHFYQAEQTGWTLYLEGATDLAILQAFAEALEHPAKACLERPFVHYVGNQPSKARDHYYGLREGKSDLAGLAIFDRLDLEPRSQGAYREFLWPRREIENYLCQPETIAAFATSLGKDEAEGALFESSASKRFAEAMKASIRDRVPPAVLRDPGDPWWIDAKASDQFLDPLFADFFKRLGLPNLMRKTDYHRLARFVPREAISPDVAEALDLVVDAARKAKPAAE